MAKKDEYYFQAFIDLFNYTFKASEYLEKVVLNFTNGIYDVECTEMHKIEHSADLALHDVLEKLAREFITPIEREDIIDIIKLIDDATDAVEDVLVYMYMHNVKKIIPSHKEFCAIIKDISLAMLEVLKEFSNYKKSQNLKEKIMNVLSIEEKGDRLYISSVKELYTNEKDALTLHVTEDLLYRFESCCDAIEEIAQAVDSAIMKNS